MGSETYNLITNIVKYACSRMTGLVRPYGGIAAEDRISARRQRLLDAGLESYGTDGYAASGVKDVARRAGLTHRYFYESFKNSEELFLAVFDAVTDELFQAAAQAVMTAEASAEAQLRNAVTSFMTAMADDPRKPRIIFSEPPAVGPAAELHMRTVLRRFAQLVQATARLHAPAAVSDATLQVVGLAIVGTLERVVIEWQDDQVDLTIEEIIDECVGIFLALVNGLA